MAGALLMPRKSKSDPPISVYGTPVRISDKALMLLRKLSGHLDKAMTDVASDLIMEHGPPLLQKLMLEEQERMKKEK